MGMLPGEMTVTDNDVLCIAAAAAAASADLITRVQQISMTANPVNGVKVSFTANPEKSHLWPNLATLSLVLCRKCSTNANLHLQVFCTFRVLKTV